MKRLFIFFALVAFFALSPITMLLGSENIEAETQIDWFKGVIAINISAMLPSEINVLPEAKIQAENSIDEAIPVVIQHAMEKVLLNSSATVLDRLKKELYLTAAIDNYSSSQYRIKTYLSKDLLKLKSSYTIPLYPDFCSTFISHKRATPIEKVIYYVPSQKYTGIIIYATEELPIFGENKKGFVNPCLFPKILNEKGEIIFSDKNMEPSVLKKRGVATYVDHLDKVPYQKAGLNPIKIEAIAVYGKHHTDLVIPQYLADMLLSKSDNRNLLQQGKISIVCAKEKIQSQIYFTR